MKDSNLHIITDYRDRALKREGRSEHIGINRRYHAKRCEQFGISHSNLVFDKDTLETELLDHDNASEIMEVLFQNIDLEENGFRDISTDTEEGYTVSTVNASSRTGSKGIDDLEDDGQRDSELETVLAELHRERCGTESIINHSIYYLGELRAWRNGWDITSFNRHVIRSKNIQAGKVDIQEYIKPLKEAVKESKKLSQKERLQAKWAARDARKAAKAV